VRVLGWDVGGANIKAALLDTSTGSVASGTHAFPLWRESERLAAVVTGIVADMGWSPDVPMALTMTAELADCFATKRDRVASVIDALETAFPGSSLHVFSVAGSFLDPVPARALAFEVAAANWMTSAIRVARARGDGVLIDVGSTTTDIIPFNGGEVAARGHTDTERLASGELVYTGALRTLVVAIVDRLPLDGRPCRVAAEVFAIAADAYRWLDAIGDGDYTCETPDGRGPDRGASGRRLARMVCADRETIGDESVTALAMAVREAQVEAIASGLDQVRSSSVPETNAAIVTGAGAFLAREAASRRGLSVLSPDEAPFPATDVAYLLAETLTSTSGS